jgi:hypothetical protein
MAKVNQYKKYSNKLNKIKLDSKNIYYNKEFETYKHNLKATWKLIGELIKRKSKGQQCPTRIMRNDKIFTTKYDISNQFNEHFVNVGPKLAESIDSTNVNPTDYIHNSSLSSFFMSPFTESEVYCQFVSLESDSKKSSLGVPNNLIKIIAAEVTPVFTFIFNRSIETGIVPDILKISRVTPIYKNGAITDPFNYRPISEIYEKRVYKRL